MGNWLEDSGLEYPRDTPSEEIPGVFGGRGLTIRPAQCRFCGSTFNGTSSYCCEARSEHVARVEDAAAITRLTRRGYEVRKVGEGG
jgi:hypothetical protein